MRLYLVKVALREEGHDPASYVFDLGPSKEPVNEPAAADSEGQPVEQTAADDPVKEENEANGNEEVVQPVDASDPIMEEEQAVDKPMNGDDEATADTIQRPDQAAETSLPAVAEEQEEEQEHEQEPEEPKEPPEEVSAAQPSPADYMARSFWIRNLPPGTSAADLKHHVTSHAQVDGAKVFTSKKAGADVTFGFVLLHDAALVDGTVAHFTNTDFKEKTITAERADKSRLPAKRAIALMAGTTTTTSTAAPTTPAVAAPPKRKPVEGPPKSDSPERAHSSAKKSDRRSLQTSSRRPAKDSKALATSIRRRGATAITSTRARDEDRRRRVAPAAVRSRDNAPRGHASSGGYQREIRIVRAPISRRPIPSGSRTALNPRVSYASREPAPHSRYGSRPISRRSRERDISPGRLQDKLRRQAEDNRRREEELKLQMERAKIAFEKEKLERQRLEIQLMQQATLSRHSEGRASHDTRHSQSSRNTKDRYSSSSARDRDTARHATDSRSRDGGRYGSSPTARHTAHGRDARSSGHNDSRSSYASSRVPAKRSHQSTRSPPRHDSRRDHSSRYPPSAGASSSHHSTSTGRVYESSSSRPYHPSSGSSRDYPSTGITNSTYAAPLNGGDYARGLAAPSFAASTYPGSSSAFDWGSVASGSSRPSFKAQPDFSVFDPPSDTTARNYSDYPSRRY
ncbi:unnamed protein product, partial [Mesorhabditis spiculigera]